MRSTSTTRIARGGLTSPALALGLALLSACTGSSSSEDESAVAPRILQPGAPGEPNTELTPEELASHTDADATVHNDADVSFMRAMYPHHRQALAMTALVEGRTERDDIPLLARRMEISQEGELELIERWLTARGEALPTDHDASQHEDDPMPGMLTSAELDALERASGAEFDQLFLESMIRHHEGALLMVARLFEQGGGLEPETFRFANDVDADQRAEIARMTDLLAVLDPPDPMSD